jgi:hypothetical protein
MKKEEQCLQSDKNSAKVAVESHGNLENWLPILSEQNGRLYVSGYGLRKSSE